MDEREQDLADRIYKAINEHSLRSERSQQASTFRVGISDLGYCSERTRRMLAQEQPDDTDSLLAFLGTAIGDHLEQAVAKHFGVEVLTQQEVSVTLRGVRRSYTLPGHPDLVIPSEHLVLDGKSAYGLSLAERSGPDQQKQFQRHLYGLAAFEGGLLGDCSLDDVMVGNVWIDRSGKQKRLHVNVETLSVEVIDAATEWIEEVVYAFTTGAEARKEPSRPVCQATCGFYSNCRQFDTDVEGLITEQHIIDAVEMYAEGQILEKRGDTYKQEAKAVLDGITGSTGKHLVRWLTVNAKRPYKRLEITSMKKAKQ